MDEEEGGDEDMRYYIFQKLEMVMPDQVDSLRQSQDGVVGWRYRPEKHILDLLFDCDIKTEQQRLDAISQGEMEIYAVPDGQRAIFHLPTRLSILDEIADAADALVNDAVGCEECFNPSEYIISSECLLSLQGLLFKLEQFDEVPA